MNVYQNNKGFTLIELLVVIAIIGILASITMAYLGSAREKSRDSNRAAQTQELLKALELYYTTAGVYPDDSSNANVELSVISGALVGGGYISRIPDDPEYDAAEGYQYCVSDDLRSMLLAVNIENDLNSDYCHVMRGPGPDYGCTYSGGSAHIDASDPCANVF